MIWMNWKKGRAWLENQDIPRAHTGFYTQCGKGLENQRHRDAQAFTLRAAEGWGTRENPKSTHRLLHSVWQRAGEPETHDTHRLLHSERHRAGEPERHSECTHRLLRSMQHREDGTNGICSYQPLHSYEEHASVTSHVFRMRDLEHIGLKRRGFFFSDGFLMITWLQTRSAECWVITIIIFIMHGNSCTM